MSAVMSESNSSNVAELLSPGPGERLRAARLSMGYDLGRVASELHLTSGVVEALEADEYADVGARVFVRGYLRNYARIVGMPVESVLRQFDEKWPEEVTLQRTISRRSPRLPSDGGPGSSLSSLMTWGLIGIVVVLFVLWWRGYLNGNEVQDTVTAAGGVAEDVTTEPAAAEPASMDLIQEDGTLLLPQAGSSAETATIPGTAADVGAPTISPPVAESAVTPAPVEIAPLSQATRAAAPPATSREPVATAGAVSETPAAGIVATTPTVVAASEGGGAPVIDAGSQIVMTFSAPCWVDVRDSERKFKLFGEMPKGSRRVLGGTPPYKVVIGNARAVSITVGGKDFDLSRYAKGNVARFTLAP